MKIFKVSLIVSCLIITCIFSALAEDLPKFGPWFDGEGAFHSESPLEYMNKVLDGKIKDPVILAEIKAAFPALTDLTADQVLKIAQTINSKTMNSAFYFTPLAGNPSIKSNLESKKDADKNGKVKLTGYGLEMQGGMHKLGGPTINIAAIFPADPIFLDILDFAGKIDQNKIQTAAEFAISDPFWSAFSDRTTVDLMGTAYFNRLAPGPYLVWVNQYNILRYLYRIQVLPDKENTVQLAKTLNLMLMSINLPDDKQSPDKTK